jgi:hypothetical protein
VGENGSVPAALDFLDLLLLFEKSHPGFVSQAFKKFERGRHGQLEDLIGFIVIFPDEFLTNLRGDYIRSHLIVRTTDHLMENDLAIELQSPVNPCRRIIVPFIDHPAAGVVKQIVDQDRVKPLELIRFVPALRFKKNCNLATSPLISFEF